MYVITPIILQMLLCVKKCIGLWYTIHCAVRLLRRWLWIAAHIVFQKSSVLLVLVLFYQLRPSRTYITQTRFVNCVIYYY